MALCAGELTVPDAARSCMSLQFLLCFYQMFDLRLILSKGGQQQGGPYGTGAMKGRDGEWSHYSNAFPGLGSTQSHITSLW